MKHVFVVILAGLLAACSSSLVAPTLEPTTQIDAAQVAGAEQPSLLADVLSDGADRPAWQTTLLTNAESGATFTLADFPERLYSSN